MAAQLHYAQRLLRKGVRLKNKIFQSRDLCLRALDTNSLCAKNVRRNEEKMKRTATKTKLLTVLLTLCMVLPMVPMTAQAAEPATETADFTAPDGGTAALALLNAAKTGEAESTWDGSTLTLNGVDFVTTATTAVKLPAGATVILADGTDNRITGGGSVAAESGGYNKLIYIYGIYATGALTIDGTGTLSVTSGEHINSGDAWTHSVAVYGAGDLTVRGGTITTNGGKASSADCAFSYGIGLAEEANLTVTGGNLIGIGGESLDTENPDDVTKSFSCGFDVYRGNISVSGTGRLEGKCVSSMDGEGLAYGVYISVGSLSVSDSAQVTATASRAIDVSNGSIQLTGGQITAVSIGENSNALNVSRDVFGSGSGNIEIAAGTLEATGGIYMSQYQPTDQQGIFAVTGGTVRSGSIYGANKFNVSGGTVQTQRISTNDLTVANTTLTVRESVKEYNGSLYAESAIQCSNLTVDSGVLDVAWDWGGYTPIVFPVETYDGFSTPLVRMYGDDYVATFNGGTTTLNTGCAGNIALKLGQLVLGNGMVETGADASQIQLSSDVPVQFAAGTTVTPINAATVANAKFDYQPGEAPQKTAAVALTEDADKYEIEYEYWEEMQADENGGVSPVAFWYSDENKNNALAQDQKITVFEEGKSYMYSIQLKAKEGYAFADGCTVKINDTAITNVRKTENGIFVFAVKTIKPAKPTPEPTPTYEIIEGANSAWEQNSDGTLTFRANGEFSKFTGVKVDGNVVPADQYTAASGSTIVTFSADYLKTLSAGAHTLTVLYNDGECSTTFEVTAAQNGNGGNGGNNTGNGGNNTGNGGNNTGNGGNNTGNGGSNTGSGGNNTGNSGSTNTGNTTAQAETNTPAVKEPKTGDSGNHLLVWSTLLVVSGGVAAGIVVYNRKRKESEAE